MTKHESHIILLLLALITAGVLVYQFANSGFDNKIDVWSNSLMNSNSEHNNYDIEIDIQPPALSVNKAHQEKSVLNNYKGDHNRYSEITGLSYGDVGSLNISVVSNSQTNLPSGGSISAEYSQAKGLYLSSDRHRESISLILGGSSAGQTTGVFFSIETLLHDIPDEMTAEHSNDPQHNHIEGDNSQHVVISQVSSENSAIVARIDAGNYAEITQQVDDRNVVHLSQNSAGNTAVIMQQGYRNRVAGSEYSTLKNIENSFSNQSTFSVMGINQTGDFNHADIVQENSDFLLVQFGTDHEISSHQYASSGAINQTGYSNSITMDQSESRATILQDGSNNKVSLHQMK